MCQFPFFATRGRSVVKEKKYTHKHFIVGVLRPVFDVAVIRCQTCWFRSENTDDEEEEDVLCNCFRVCPLLNAVQECSQCVDSPVFFICFFFF